MSAALPLRWPVGHGVHAAYSTAADGDAREPAARQRIAAGLGLERRPLLIPRQVHGVRIVGEDAAAGELAIADGAVARRPGTVLGAYGADCPGIVLAAPDAFAVAHAGWRGCAGGIVATLVAALRPHAGAPPTAWTALVGPGISGSAYEVDAPVLAARAWPAEALRPGRPGHAWLDLAAVLAADLAAAGVGAVARCGVCTAGDGRLHSYRHHGPGRVQVLMAWRAAPG